MLEGVFDFFARCFELKTAGWFVLFAFTGLGYTLIAVMLGDQGSALLGTPILALGAAVGNAAFADLGIQSSADPLVNMTVGMAAGMMVGAGLMVGLLWSWNASMGR